MDSRKIPLIGRLMPDPDKEQEEDTPKGDDHEETEEVVPSA